MSLSCLSTDYFNYGFTEDTWRAYCERQKRMRLNESGVGIANLPVKVEFYPSPWRGLHVSVISQPVQYRLTGRPFTIYII